MSNNEHEIPVKVVDRRWWAQNDATGADAGEARSPLKPTYVEELERQLAEKDRQLQEYIAKYRHAAQEFDESRLRLRREVARDVERGRRELLADLLDVIDNLDRALESARQSTSSEGLLQGVELVRRQFLAKLESFGVKRIEAMDAPFDPTLHEAVSMVPAPTPDRGGLVVGIVRHGYRIGDDVLRPVAVAVSKA